MTPEENLLKLLRLKRHEQPPPGYFDDFVAEFRDRQRAELMQLSLREIIWERICDFLQPFQVPRLAYATVAAVAVAASVAIIARPSAQLSGGLASTRQPMSLTAPQPVMIGNSVPVSMASTSSPSVHYVLPTQPANYASPRSF